MQVEEGLKPEGQRRPPAEFWERDDIVGARNALDVWASCSHARLSGCDHAPTFETIFEFPRPEVFLEDRLHYAEVDAGPAGTLNPAATVRLVEYGVHWAMLNARLPALAPSLALWLYPRTGPYQITAYSKGLEDPVASRIRSFRPPSMFILTGDNPSPRIQSRADSILNEIHREIVIAVANVAKMPAEVFEQEIVKIGTPGKPKRLNKRAFERSNRAIEDDFLKITGLGSKDVVYAFSLLHKLRPSTQEEQTYV